MLVIGVEKEAVVTTQMLHDLINITFEYLQLTYKGHVWRKEVEEMLEIEDVSPKTFHVPSHS